MSVTPRRLRILAVTRKPDSPSFEQRVLRFIDPLAERGIDVTTAVYNGSPPSDANDYDGVWWHRNILSFARARQLKRIRVPLLFDFDDPLMFTSRGEGRPSLTRRFRFAWTAKRMTAAIPASEHLASLVAPYCGDTTVVPMACDLPAAPTPIDQRPGPTQLLWVGSASTQSYLRAIVPALDQLAARRPEVSVRLVAHAPMDLGKIPVDFRPWSPEAQEAALQECHVGLCPMPDALWARGKCPYKVLQYMAYAMPWVGSDVGENPRVAGNAPGQTPRGLVADTADAWGDALTTLVDEPGRRIEIGQAARRYIQLHHERGALADRLAQQWHRLVSPAGHSA